MSHVIGALIDGMRLKKVESLHCKQLPNNPEIDIGWTFQEESETLYRKVLTYRTLFMFLIK